MTSEWEQLEKLTKDELIIELVKTRWEKRNLQNVLGELCKTGGAGMVYEPGAVPPEKWQKKIADYAFKNLEGGHYSDLTEWGVDEDVGDKLYDEYYSEHFDKNGRRIDDCN